MFLIVMALLAVLILGVSVLETVPMAVFGWIFSVGLVVVILGAIYWTIAGIAELVRRRD